MTFLTKIQASNNQQKMLYFLGFLFLFYGPQIRTETEIKKNRSGI